MCRIDKEISAMLRLVQSTRESLESITQNYNSDGAQVTKDPHKFDRLIELEALVDSKVDEQIELKAEILRTIMQLDNRPENLLVMKKSEHSKLHAGENPTPRDKVTGRFTRKG